MTLLRNAALTAWQGAYASEPPLRITGRHPARRSEASRVGVNLGTALLRYVDDGLVQLKDEDLTPEGRVPIGHEHGPACWTKGIGSNGRDFPVHDSLIRWERYCRSKHRRWPDHRGQPVCADIAWAVIRDRTTLQWAAAFNGVTDERALRMLLEGVAFMQRHQDRWVEEQTERVSHDRDACPQCVAMA